MQQIQDIKQYIEQLCIIDTHEHLPNCNKNRDQNGDFFREYLDDAGYMI